MLACPSCQQPFAAPLKRPLACGACNNHYPALGPVPFCWPDPGNMLLDWRNRFNLALSEIEYQQSLATMPPSLPQSTQRLQRLSTALGEYTKQLTEILQPMKVGDALARETHMALGTQLPGHHGMLSYTQNIFRDWAWGDDENEQVIQHLTNILASADAPAPESILVLGAGAGRLAYDLHRCLQPRHTWALDSNPLLCLIGARMCQGSTLELTEFPLAPIGSEEVAVNRHLRAPAPTDGISFVCADALNPPFATQSFDLVVSPWLLDVIDASPARCISTIAHLLTAGGLWLNHGSLAFTGNPQRQLSPDEFGALSAQGGFDVIDARDAWLPYLQSPASRHHRRELTFTQLARLAKLPKGKSRKPHEHLPDWITKGSTAIPLTPQFQTQIMTTRIHAFIMSLIDGKRSINDIALELERQRLMPQAEATAAIRQFVSRMFEEARHSSGPEDA